MDSKPPAEISIPIKPEEKDQKSLFDFKFYFFTFLILTCTSLILICDHTHFLNSSNPQTVPQNLIVNYFYQTFEENSEKLTENHSCDIYESQADEIFEDFYENFPKVEKSDANLQLDNFLTYTNEILDRAQKVTDKTAEILNLNPEEVFEFFWTEGDDESEENFPLSCFSDDFYEIRDFVKEALKLPEFEENSEENLRVDDENLFEEDGENGEGNFEKFYDDLFNVESEEDEKVWDESENEKIQEEKFENEEKENIWVEIPEVEEENNGKENFDSQNEEEILKEYEAEKFEENLYDNDEIFDDLENTKIDQENLEDFNEFKENVEKALEEFLENDKIVIFDVNGDKYTENVKFNEIDEEMTDEDFLNEENLSEDENLSNDKNREYNENFDEVMHLNIGENQINNNDELNENMDLINQNENFSELESLKEALEDEEKLKDQEELITDDDEKQEKKQKILGKWKI